MSNREQSGSIFEQFDQNTYNELPDTDLPPQGVGKPSRRQAITGLIAGASGLISGAMINELRRVNDAEKIEAYVTLTQQFERDKSVYMEGIEDVLPVIAALLNYSTDKVEERQKPLPDAIRWLIDRYKEVVFDERTTNRLQLLPDAYVHFAKQLKGDVDGVNQQAQRMAFLAAYVLTMKNPINEVSTDRDNALGRELKNFDTFMNGFTAISKDNLIGENATRIQKLMLTAIINLVPNQDFQSLKDGYNSKYPDDIQKEGAIGQFFLDAIDRMIQIINPQ